jgi:hypothetical protein
MWSTVAMTPAASQKLGGLLIRLVEEGQGMKIDHLLQKRPQRVAICRRRFQRGSGDGGNGGALLGLAPEVGLSISLIKCIRKIALGVPPLLVWQAVVRRFLSSAGRQRGGNA